MRRFAIILGLLVWALIICIKPAWSADYALEKIIISSEQSSLLVYSYLNPPEGRKLERFLRNGGMLNLDFRLSLRRVWPGWIDKELASSVVQHQASYDPVRGQYTVAIFHEGDKNFLVTREDKEMRRFFFSLEGVRIGSIKELRPQMQYYVQIQAQLQSNEPQAKGEPQGLDNELNLILPWVSSPQFAVSGHHE